MVTGRALLPLILALAGCSADAGLLPDPQPREEGCCASFRESWVGCCSSCVTTCRESSSASYCATECGPSCRYAYDVGAGDACGWCPAVGGGC